MFKEEKKVLFIKFKCLNICVQNIFTDEKNKEN